jgi:hypothetical protein
MGHKKLTPPVFPPDRKESKSDPSKAIKKQEDLRLILKPFADWAWGDPVKADAVIDKYFNQVINK